MKAVILAAGVGSRLAPLTNNTPKSLIKIREKTILERMIINIDSMGIKDTLIVTGFLEDQIRNFVKSKFPNLNLTFFTNQKYDVTNTAYSLMLAKDFVQGSNFIKFDADVIFEKEILEKLINNKALNCLCMDRNINLAAEEVKVITDKRGQVLQVGKKLDPKLSTGESIGIEKISKETGKVLFKELENLMRNLTNYQRYYDDSYTTLVEKGLPFYAVDITGLRWVEIDNFEDFNLATKLIW